MKKPLKHYITVNNKKYSYTLQKKGKKTTYVECEAANIGQEFLNEDIPGLLNDLGNLIIAEKEYKKQQEEMIRFRVSAEDKRQIEKNAIKKGYPSVSSFLRDLGLGKA